MGPVRVLPASGAGESYQPYPVKKFLRGVLGPQPCGGVTEQPRREFGAQDICVVPRFPWKLVSQQVVLPVGCGLGQVPVGNVVIDCLPGVESRAERADASVRSARTSCAGTAGSGTVVLRWAGHCCQRSRLLRPVRRGGYRSVPHRRLFAQRSRRDSVWWPRSARATTARQTSSESLSGGGLQGHRVALIPSSLFPYSAVKRVFGSVLTHESRMPFTRSGGRTAELRSRSAGACSHRRSEPGDQGRKP